MGKIQPHSVFRAGTSSLLWIAFHAYAIFLGSASKQPAAAVLGLCLGLGTAPYGRSIGRPVPLIYPFC